jgi:hypothetical protein
MESRPKSRIALTFSLLAVPFLLLTGCSKKPAFGVVSGKVSMGNTPLSSGTISFVSIAGGIPVSGPINADGTYRVDGVPAGDCLVSIVDPTDPNVASEQGMVQKRFGQQVENGLAEPQALPAPIIKHAVPNWYGDPVTSGLSVKVQDLQQGETTYEIVLSNKQP